MSRALSRLADIVIANEHEWSLLSGQAETPSAVKGWSIDHGQIIVVTRGASGVCVASPFEYFEIGAPDIRPVDTVGAGDTFCGFLAAALDACASLREAVRTAVVAASLACLKAGAQASIPNRDDVFRAMQQGVTDERATKQNSNG